MIQVLSTSIYQEEFLSIFECWPFSFSQIFERLFEFTKVKKKAIIHSTFDCLHNGNELFLELKSVKIWLCTDLMERKRIWMKLSC